MKSIEGRRRHVECVWRIGDCSVGSRSFINAANLIGENQNHLNFNHENWDDDEKFAQAHTDVLRKAYLHEDDLGANINHGEKSIFTKG